MAVAQKFGLPEIMPTEIKELDHAMLALEANSIMKVPPKDWYFPFPPPENVSLEKCWSPEHTENVFLDAFSSIVDKNTPRDSLASIRRFALGQV